MDIIITLAVFGIPMFFLIKYLNKKAEKEKRYYTHEQLKAIEMKKYPSGYDDCGISITPYSMWDHHSVSDFWKC